MRGNQPFELAYGCGSVVMIVEGDAEEQKAAACPFTLGAHALCRDCQQAAKA